MRKLVSIMLICMLVIALVPVSGLASKENNTFIYGIGGDPGNDVNTITTSGRYDLMTERMLYSPLYSYYGPDDISWFLAESYEVSEDGMTLTVNLRKDVVWSDGEPFTSADVVFTYDFIINTDYANGHDGLVFNGQKTTVEAIDDYTVKFTTPIFVPSMVENLGNEHYIMPKHIYEGDETLDNNPKNATPVGTGPYMLEDYQAGQYVKFTANPTYFKGEPAIKTVYFQIVSDQNSAMMALKTGEINALVLSNDYANDFAGTPVEIIAYPEDRVGYADFIMTSDKVQDINFRKACFFAFNRYDMNVGAYLSEDFFVNAVSFLPYSNPFFTDELETYERNVETAKEYLAKAENVPDSITIAYGVGNSQQEVQALVMQQNLREIGVNAEVQAVDSTGLYDSLRNGTCEYDMFLGGYIMGIDPSAYACLFVSDGAANYSKMSDPELDALFAAGAVETDSAKRIEIYNQAQAQLADDAIHYTIVTNSRLLGVSSDVGGIEDARLIPIYTFDDMSGLYFK